MPKLIKKILSLPNNHLAIHEEVDGQQNLKIISLTTQQQDLVVTLANLNDISLLANSMLMASCENETFLFDLTSLVLLYRIPVNLSYGLLMSENSLIALKNNTDMVHYDLTTLVEKKFPISADVLIDYANGFKTFLTLHNNNYLAYSSGPGDEDYFCFVTWNENEKNLLVSAELGIEADKYHALCPLNTKNCFLAACEEKENTVITLWDGDTRDNNRWINLSNLKIKAMSMTYDDKTLVVHTKENNLYCINMQEKSLIDIPQAVDVMSFTITQTGRIYYVNSKAEILILEQADLKTELSQHTNVLPDLCEISLSYLTHSVFFLLPEEISQADKHPAKRFKK